MNQDDVEKYTKALIGRLTKKDKKMLFEGYAKMPESGKEIFVIAVTEPLVDGHNHTVSQATGVSVRGVRGKSEVIEAIGKELHKWVKEQPWTQS